MKEDVIITSISKAHKNAPWRVSVRLESSYTFFYVGRGGRVATSPRFNDFLLDVEKNVTRYPVDVSFYHILENRNVKVTRIKEEITYIDCDMRLRKLIPNGRYYYEREVLGNPLHVESSAVRKENDDMVTFSTLAEEDTISSRSIDYVVIGEVMNVLDGDTIRVKIKTNPGKVTKLNKGDEITVRFNGIDAPEYKESNEANDYKDQVNSEFARSFGVTMKEIEEVAKESKKYLEDLVGKTKSSKPLVAVHFDRESDGKKPIKDGYDRYIADVFASKESKNADIFLSNLVEGKSFTHANKTMLVEKSKKHSHIPLAIYTIEYSFKSTTRLNSVNWGPELGVSPIELAQGEVVKEIASKIESNEGDPDLEMTGDSIKDGVIKFSPDSSAKPNSHSFFPPYDDRIDTFLKGIKTIDDMRSHSRMRIGDVMFVIPPTSIQVNKTSNISKVKTLRTKSSVMVNKGQSLTTITLDLYFHDLESINGKAIKRKKGSKDVFYVDGLRPLLAQFSKAPFVPIDNYFVNEIVGINDVALMDISITTVPDFPESITATITLVEFNAESYLMTEDSLGDCINYPMLRWFYNTSLSEAGRGPKYRSFERIEGPITSDISFTLADQNQLEMRKEAIEWLKSADSPEKVKVDLKTKNDSYKEKKEDATRIDKILDQRRIYYGTKIEKYTVIDYFYLAGTSGFNDSVVNKLVEKYKIKKDVAENAIVAGRELYVNMYGEDMQDTHLTSEPNVFIPYEAGPFYKTRFGYKGIPGWNKSQLDIDYSKKPYKGLEKYGLIIMQEPVDAAARDRLRDMAEEYYSPRLKKYFLPATNEIVSLLVKIGNQSYEMEKAVESYEEVFNSYLRIIDASEQGIQMRPYKINGTCIPISIAARFTNEFSMAHVIAGEAPTLQFLGGGDPYLDIILELDDIAAQDFTNLISTSDYYAKTYNQGITNGYIGVNNQLAQLLGMKYLMFENIQINTVPGFPGRYQAVIQAVGFDKTQRQREELRGIPNNHKNVKLDDLSNGKYDYINDRMLEARMHNLEVYPDLELPTYDQLNIALKGIDAKCKEYPNRTNGLYVDPDFYISTGETLREIIESSYQDNHQLNMFDAIGVSGYTSSTDTEKVFNTTEEDYASLKEIEDTEGVEPIDWVFSWGDEDVETEEAEDTSVGTTLAESVGDLNFGNKDVEEFLNKKTNEEHDYFKFPSEKEWNNLFSNNSNHEYSSASKKPNGTETQIYNHLSKLVDKHFKGYISEPDFIKTLTGNIDESGKKSLKEVSYSDPKAMAYSSFEAHHLLVLTGKGYEAEQWKLLKKQIGKEIKKPSKPNKDSGMKSKYLQSLECKPTKERIMTLLKAFLDKTNSWRHFDGDKPLLSRSGRVGIGQVDVTSEHMTVNEVKRLMYSWKYNLDVAVGQLAAYYKGHKNLKKDNSNFIPFSRPWDAMFASYNNPEKEFNSTKSIDEDEIASSVMARFVHYAHKPFNTISGFNSEIYKKYSGLSSEEKLVFSLGDKDSYIDSLMRLEYYDLDVLKSNSLTIKSPRKEITSVMKKSLSGKTVEELDAIYQKHVRVVSELGTFGNKRKDSNGYEYLRDTIKLGKSQMETLDEMSDAAASSQVSSDTRLYNDVDPHVLYTEMYHDLRQYDQRGRMVRAFPGFQMFIVHEGEFYGKYKFWDNMYGFNAISSIDVYKSRKIAADTAVIEMTNVYSNLTTRRTDVDYVDREIKWWENAIWNTPPEELVDKKAHEFHKNIFLEPGARIHLRMGYASNVSDLPTVFNGTIAEVNTGDLMQIVAQGDGVELGNVLSGDPDDDNDGLFMVTEPRDLICKLLSSKGSWWKDFMNKVSDGSLFARNPLGIQHFGQPFDTDDNSVSKPAGNLIWYNDEYGEVAQNIYSANGTPTFSQWVHPNGERNWIFSSLTWKNLWNNKTKLFNPGDEKNVVVKFYNNTVWDVIQTITYTSPDYIAAVAPFEFRSTLFFGKPYWRCAFEYGSEYTYDATTGEWERHLRNEVRRPYMQHRFYNSHQDILQNNIKASDDGLFTNVIVNYDGKQTPLLYADADIRYDKQRTRVVEADIVAKLNDFYTSEVIASYFGMSALRDNLKDMYRGSLTVMGDPSVKPHDMMYVADDINDMAGPALVKAVTHHFSIETGFISSIEPDLLVVNDDQVILDVGKWQSSFMAGIAGGVIGGYAAKKGSIKLGKWIKKAGKLPTKAGSWLTTKGLERTLLSIDDGDLTSAMKIMRRIIDGGDKADIAKLQGQLAKELENVAKGMKKPPKGSKMARLASLRKRTTLMSTATIMANLSGATKTAQAAKTVGGAAKGAVNIARGAANFTGIGFVVNIATWIGTEMIFEKYKRFKEHLQCVIAIPLSYRGQEFVAGINNHAGMIYGDSPGRMKRVFDATWGGKEDKEVDSMFGTFLIKTINWITGSGGTYSNEEVSDMIIDEFYEGVGKYGDQKKMHELTEMGKSK